MLIIYSTYNCVTLTRILSTAKPVFLVVMRYKTIVISCFIRFRTNADKILRTNSFALRWFVANGCRCNAGVWVSDLGCRYLRTVGLIAIRPEKPDSQTHLWDAPCKMHAPCLQGFVSHALSVTSQYGPVNPETQWQTCPRMFEVQFPPFLHGEEAQ